MKKILVLGFSIMLCLMTSLTSCSSDPIDEELDHPSADFSFREPLLSWEADQNEVMDFMTGYPLVSSSQYSLIYEGKDAASSYLYAFTKNGSLLTYVTISFDNKYKDKVKDFISEKYIRLGESDGNAIYTDEGHSTVITTASDSQFYLTYMSYEYMAK